MQSSLVQIATLIGRGHRFEDGTLISLSRQARSTSSISRPRQHILVCLYLDVVATWYT